MKILVLSYEYPPLGGGGGRVAQTVAEQMVGRGHSVRVQTAALGVRSVRENLKGVEVYRTASLRRREDRCSVSEMGLYCSTSFLPALQHIRKWQPDVIHAHFAVPTGLLAYAVHKLTGVPYVLTAHLGDVPGGVPEQTAALFRLVNPIARRVWANASGCTAVSSFVKGLAELAYNRPVTRILNGISLEGRPAVSLRESGALHLAFVGRFSVQKNPVFLIEVLAQLKGTPWHCILVGDGPLMGEVRSRIAHEGLGDHVTITGWLEAPAVQAILAKTDVLLMPSLSEGLPVAAVEALKQGVAIVASDIPGVHDIVEDGVNGYRIALGSAEAFAKKIRQLLSDRNTLNAMKQASWEKAQLFDLDAITDQYENVLRSAAK